MKNSVFVAVAVGCWSKIDLYFLSNEIEVALLLFYPMVLKLTSSAPNAVCCMHTGACLNAFELEDRCLIIVIAN